MLPQISEIPESTIYRLIKQGKVQADVEGSGPWVVRSWVYLS